MYILKENWKKEKKKKTKKLTVGQPLSGHENGSNCSSMLVSLHLGCTAATACSNVSASTVFVLSVPGSNSNVLFDVMIVPTSDLAFSDIRCLSSSRIKLGKSCCVSSYVEFRVLASFALNNGFECRFFGGRVLCSQDVFRFPTVFGPREWYVTKQRPEASRSSMSLSNTLYCSKLATPRLIFAEERLSAVSMKIECTSPSLQTIRKGLSASVFILEECSTNPSGSGALRDLIHSCGCRNCARLKNWFLFVTIWTAICRKQLNDNRQKSEYNLVSCTFLIKCYTILQHLNTEVRLCKNSFLI